MGTTSCRTLESAAGEDGIVKAGSGWTEIFIYPGYKFKAIDGLITNFPSAGVHASDVSFSPCRKRTYYGCL